MSVPTAQPSGFTKESTASRISQIIRSRILEGSYPAGMQLRQTELANELNVSPIPVREALQRLSFEGMVEQIANRGAFVASIGVDDFKNIWVLRRNLEVMAVQQAMENPVSEAAVQAKEIIKQAANETDNMVLVDLNWKFHLCLYKPCGNDILLDFINGLYRKADRYSCMLWTTVDYGRQAQLEHSAIVEHYEAGDTAQAAQQILHHIDEVERMVMSVLGSRLSLGS
ncbi:GntR family transcriptional regulator [Lentibacter algarum]|uniref:GntR family transcriptional regulator n=1 Tax=Lentibacter algarum TaxID=576131 RepID=UPI001C07D40B|nr:GntR family transcriptional regulator [Lentibacter algarum]MBU2982007.1 GntR family transcriptional regulator [Lentibacter algarum]